MKKQITILFVMALFVFVGCTTTNAQKSELKRVTPAEFSQLMQQDVQLVDVRTDQEYQSGHLQGAAQIDINSPSFSEKLAKLDKTKPVLVYCASGGRSSRASQTLKSMGFEQVYDLQGGISNWMATGNKVVKD
ncbi:MAG: rhodanese-like domain-containing protein [Cyclobacteriaceae bacterium]|nr:rhodanese-like domain-containing protein [Cyclobacteriaceae bacterium]